MRVVMMMMLIFTKQAWSVAVPNLCRWHGFVGGIPSKGMDHTSMQNAQLDVDASVLVVLFWIGKEQAWQFMNQSLRQVVGRIIIILLLLVLTTVAIAIAVVVVVVVVRIMMMMMMMMMIQ
jgi:hypothetical protein